MGDLSRGEGGEYGACLMNSRCKLGRIRAYSDLQSAQKGAADKASFSVCNQSWIRKRTVEIPATSIEQKSSGVAYRRRGRREDSNKGSR